MRDSSIKYKLPLLILISIITLNAFQLQENAHAQTIKKVIDGDTYHLRLLTKDNFSNLDNWIIEARQPGKIKVKNNVLQCDTRGFGATLWNKTYVEGPSIIEYEVQSLEGKNNLNGIFYGSIRKNNKERLLATTKQRTGAYPEYHRFQNYIGTYVSPKRDGVWRVRFRKNPGFNLLSETYFDKRYSPKYRRITYIFESDGTMRLYVDNRLLHRAKDTNTPYTSGYHALRTWETRVNYKNFKIYSIVSSPHQHQSTPNPPKDLKIMGINK